MSPPPPASASTVPTNVAGVGPPGDELRWFWSEVYPHEPVLRRWLQNRFPSLTDIDDLIQEAYARLIRAHRTRKIARPKNYLFATARNAAIDVLNKRELVPSAPLGDSEAYTVLQESPTVTEQVSRSQELQILQDAMSSLPPRCREVFTLRKLYRLSHAEICSRLGISHKTVEAHIHTAMLHCAAYLRDRGLP